MKKWKVKKVDERIKVLRGVQPLIGGTFENGIVTLRKRRIVREH